jgi:hypothetical protein
MTTSGSVDFSMTRNEIITDSLMLLGVLGQEEAIRNEDLTTANRALNRLIKHFENQALHIWKRSEATVFLQKDQNKFTLGLGSTDHVTENYNQTSLSGDEASGQTIISVSSISGITINDYIGIVLSDGSTHWSTVSSIGVDTVTINDALTGDASSDAYVWTYTSKINKPLSIYNARRHEISSETDIEMNLISYEDYQNLPNKTTNSGTPIQWNYDRKTSVGYLYVWPIASNASYLMKITFAKPLEDFDSAGNTPDLPQEWYDALVYQLAVRLAPMYGMGGKQEFLILKGQADEILAQALAFDDEKTYITFKPDSRYAD